MPELPEIVNFKKYVDSTSLEQTIRKVEVLNEKILEQTSPEGLQSAIQGRRFISTSFHGKYLFLKTDNELELVLHFGMTGRPVYFKKDEMKPEYPRLEVRFDNGYRLTFDCMRMLGKVRLIENRERFLEEKQLGPDALRQVDKPEIFLDRLKNRRGMIKSALMDQSLIAGIGNECSDEILFQSGIHPNASVPDLYEGALRAIYDNMRSVLKTKIDAGPENRDLPESYILRHRSEGAECPRCGGTIERIRVSGRNGYYCPHCQQKQL